MDGESHVPVPTGLGREGLAERSVQTCGAPELRGEYMPGTRFDSGSRAWPRPRGEGRVEVFGLRSPNGRQIRTCPSCGREAKFLFEEGGWALCSACGRYA